MMVEYGWNVKKDPFHIDLANERKKGQLLSSAGQPALELSAACLWKDGSEGILASNNSTPISNVLL